MKDVACSRGGKAPRHEVRESPISSPRHSRKEARQGNLSAASVNWEWKPRTLEYQTEEERGGVTASGCVSENKGYPLLGSL